MQEKAHHDVRMHALLIYRCVCTRVAHAERGGRVGCEEAAVNSQIRRHWSIEPMLREKWICFSDWKKKIHLQLRSCRKGDN